MLAGVAAYAVMVLADVGGEGYDALRDIIVYNGLLVAAALFCLARPLSSPDARLAWTLIGVGLAFWVVGDLYYEVAFANADEVPFPSVADAFYLAFYPPVYAGLALLLRTRLQDIAARRPSRTAARTGWAATSSASSPRAGRSTAAR